VDLDPQGNMTYAMAADPAGPTSLDMMLNGTDALLVIQQGDQIDTPLIYTGRWGCFFYTPKWRYHGR